jgi:adenine phosphoribosyltransferase
MKDKIEKMREEIRKVPDFPKKGILFYDIFGIFADPAAYNNLIDIFVHQIEDKDIKYVVAIDSRGFLPGLLLAKRLNVGFVPIRKAGKLPPPVVSSDEFDYEYATMRFEMNEHVLKKGDKVVLIDDVLATGNSLLCAYNLLKDFGADVQMLICILELTTLGAREKFKDLDLFTLIKDIDL